MITENASTAFVTTKKNNAYELAVRYRQKSKITSPGAPFEKSSRIELNGLIGNGTLRPITKQSVGKAKKLGSKIVNEVKGNKEHPYKKLRIMAQGFNNEGKKELLTEAFTIIKCSQRLLFAFAPLLMQKGFVLWLRNIIQAYTQADTEL